LVEADEGDPFKNMAANISFEAVKELRVEAIY
jgi:hypothetical protein